MTKQAMRFFFLVLLLTLISGVFAVSPVLAVSSGPIYWGSYVSNAQIDNTQIDKFEAAAGKHQSIIHFGWPWLLNNVEQPFPTSWFESIRLRGSIPMENWDSWEMGAGVNSHGFGPSTITLADVYNGKYDAFVTKWAQGAKTWGHPFFLRFDHEMNGWWYPWNEQANGNKPGEYIKAWRHVHDIFTRVGASNVTWVWCPNVEDDRTTPLAELYPGDNYVDWTCFDSYNNAHDLASWLTPNQVFGYHPWGHHNTYQDLINLAPGKPVMIAETATSNTGGDPAAWIKDAYLTQLPQNFPQIKAIVWFNAELEHKIEDTPAKQAAFKSSIASSYYTANTFANLPSGPIKPPASTSITTTFKDVGDSYVDGSQPSSTAGGPSLTLLASGFPYRVSFLRFDLTSLAGKTITNATLRLRTSNSVGSGSGANFDVFYVVSNTWNGATMSMNNSVPISTTKFGTLIAPSQPGNWYESNFTASALQGKGLVSMAIVNKTTTDGLVFYSKEGDLTYIPQLVVTYH